jgi:hypothetical protein
LGRIPGSRGGFGRRGGLSVGSAVVDGLGSISEPKGGFGRSGCCGLLVEASSGLDEGMSGFTGCNGSVGASVGVPAETGL